MAQLKEKNTANKDLHLIPQNTDAEEAVLGAILVNPVVLTKVVESLKPDCFYKPAHRHIYEAMLQLFNSNERIDIVSVSNVLDYSQKLETVGGRAFINDLALNAISTANIEYYSKIIPTYEVKQLPTPTNFHKPDKAKTIALARIDLLNLWKNQRKNQQNKTHLKIPYFVLNSKRVLSHNCLYHRGG